MGLYSGDEPIRRLDNAVPQRPSASQSLASQYTETNQNPSYKPETTVAEQSEILQAQHDIDETIGQMRENLASISERGSKLDTLSDKTGKLTISP